MQLPKGGQGRSESLAKTRLGMYNGVLLHSDSRVTVGANSSTNAAITTVRRAVFAGSQAACIAYGRDNGSDRYTWVEELFDLTVANDNRVLLAA